MNGKMQVNTSILWQHNSVEGDWRKMQSLLNVFKDYFICVDYRDVKRMRCIFARESQRQTSRISTEDLIFVGFFSLSWTCFPF
jgi:hypothetical protein